MPVNCRDCAKRVPSGGHRTGCREPIRADPAIREFFEIAARPDRKRGQRSAESRRRTHAG